MNHKNLVVGCVLIIAVSFCMATAVLAQANIRNNKKPMIETKTADTRSEKIEQLIKELDTAFQLAVKNNDVETMDRILADDFVLVTGRGKVYTKTDLLEQARRRTTTYEHQEDSRQTVRVWGDTAVITAFLWEKGVSEGQAFDKKLWFSDVYKLTPSGWKYVFAQSSIPLPEDD